jgi:hypothetical protein
MTQKQFTPNKIPAWVKVEEMSFKDRCEIQLYKMVALLPVTCTFTLYIFISTYYVFVSICGITVE